MLDKYDFICVFLNKDFIFNRDKKIDYDIREYLSFKCRDEKNELIR